MKDVCYPHAGKYTPIHLIQTYMRQSLTWLMDKKILELEKDNKRQNYILQPLFIQKVVFL